MDEIRRHQRAQRRERVVSWLLGRETAPPRGTQRGS